MQFESASEYYAAQSETARKALYELKNCILNVAPHATELLNYNIPAYSLVEGGKREEQIMIAANKTSVGLYPHPTTMEKFRDELKPYKSGKGSVQFPLDKEIPTNLVCKMVAYRLEYLTKS